jgi:hypothetical protein
MSFKRSIIPLHIQYSYIYTWRNSPCFPLTLLAPLCSPFVSPSTYLAPSSCDRNRPPQSQVACKLTPFAPPFTQPTPPLQIPRNPTAQRLTKTTSGIFRLLLSGTLPSRGRQRCCRQASFLPFSTGRAPAPGLWVVGEVGGHLFPDRVRLSFSLRLHDSCSL